MEFTALAPWKLIVLMAAGGLFSLAGLWLIFRPKRDGQSMVIHVAGMKLEASSAGVPVFLIGTAFFATPLFVQESGGQQAPALSATVANGKTGAATPDPGDATIRPRDVTPQSVSTRPARAITAVGNEVEPNDNIAEANEIEVGSLIHGEVSQDNVDYYSFTFPANYVGDFTVNLNANSRTGFAMFDSLGGEILKGNPKKYSSEVRETRYYIGVWTKERRTGYGLTVAAQPR